MQLPGCFINDLVEMLSLSAWQRHESSCGTPTPATSQELVAYWVEIRTVSWPELER